METGAVISRPAGGKLARGVVEPLKPARGYTDALEAAIRTRGPGLRRLHNSPSLEENAILVTGDEAMGMHASRIGARALLLRAVPEKELKRTL